MLNVLVASLCFDLQQLELWLLLLLPSPLTHLTIAGKGVMKSDGKPRFHKDGKVGV
jgi:hypothetical protein